jgi:magnesium transporter
MLRLTALLGRPVVDAGGRELGRIDDLGVHLDAAHPAVIATRIRRRRERTVLGCALIRFTDERLVIVEAPAPAGDLLLLRRHVLDAQMVDLDGRRLVRIGDVFLAEEGEGLALVAVEAGIAPVLRRLGLGRLARGRGDEIVDWRDLHPASAPGHVLALRGRGASIQRLTRPQLEELALALPPARAHELRRHFRLPARPRRGERRRRRAGRRYGSVLRFRTRAPR